MLTRHLTPMKKTNFETKLNLVVVYVSAGADILDLMEYTNRQDVIDIFDGVQTLFSRLFC